MKFAIEIVDVLHKSDRLFNKIPSSRLIHFLLHKQLHVTPPTKIKTIAVSPDFLSEGEGKFLLLKKNKMPHMSETELDSSYYWSENFHAEVKIS